MMLYKMVAMPMSVHNAATILCIMKGSSLDSPLQVGDAVVVVTPKELGKGGSKRKSKRKKTEEGDTVLRCSARKSSKKDSSLKSSSKEEILDTVVVPTPKGMTFNGERWVSSQRTRRSASSRAFARIVEGRLNKGAYNV